MKADGKRQLQATLHMLDEMAGRSIAPDLEETMREPLALTCYLPVAEVPVYEAEYEAEDGATSCVKERPQRVIVTPVRGAKQKQPEQAVILPRPAIGAPAWRPQRAQPKPVRSIQRARPEAAARTPPKVSPRSNTIRGPEDFDLRSLAMFWGVALSGSLVAIGIALTSW